MKVYRSSHGRADSVMYSQTKGPGFKIHLVRQPSTKLVKDYYNVQAIGQSTTDVSWHSRDITSDNNKTFIHEKTTFELAHYHHKRKHHSDVHVRFNF